MQRFQLGSGHHRIRLPVLTGHRGECFLSGGRLRSRLEPNVISVHRDIGPAYLVGHQHNCLLSDQNSLFSFIYAVSTCQEFNFFSLRILFFFFMKCIVGSPQLDWNICFLDYVKSCYSTATNVKWWRVCVVECLFVDVMKLCFERYVQSLMRYSLVVIKASLVLINPAGQLRSSDCGTVW